MSEATIQADIKRELLRITATFSTGDVVVDDWSVLDGPNANAPYVIIETSDTFSMGTPHIEGQTITWTIPMLIVEKFSDWDTSRAALGATRQIVINWLRDTDNYHQSSGRLAYGLRGLRSLEPLLPIFDRYEENPAESLPVFLGQTIAAIVDEPI